VNESLRIVPPAMPHPPSTPPPMTDQRDHPTTRSTKVIRHQSTSPHPPNMMLQSMIFLPRNTTPNTNPLQNTSLLQSTSHQNTTVSQVVNMTRAELRLDGVVGVGPTTTDMKESSVTVFIVMNVSPPEKSVTLTTSRACCHQAQSLHQPAHHPSLTPSSLLLQTNTAT